MQTQRMQTFGTLSSYGLIPQASGLHKKTPKPPQVGRRVSGLFEVGKELKSAGQLFQFFLSRVELTFISRPSISK